MLAFTGRNPSLWWLSESPAQRMGLLNRKVRGLGCTDNPVQVLLKTKRRRLLDGAQSQEILR
jgi:hypothetical protein